jgi:hypothetical protein
MPTRHVVYTRLQSPLADALDTLGEEVKRKSQNRRRRESGLARRPSELPYLRKPEEVQAATRLAARITADRDLPEPPAPEPYKSPEDLLTERLEKVPLVDTSKAEQLSLFPLPA